MELRVLVAVFVTLFGIAVGMAGGDVEGDRLLNQLSDMDKMTELDPGTLMNNGFKLFNKDTPPEATHPLTADLVASETTTIGVTFPATVTVTPGKNADIRLADATVSQLNEQSVQLHDFTGTLTFGDTVTIDGKTGAVATAPMTMNYSDRKEVMLTTVNASGRMTVVGQDIAFDAVSGKVDVQGTEINLAQDKAQFTGLEGAIQFNATVDEHRYRFDGAVASATFREEPTQMTIGE